MSTDDNKALILRWWEAFNQHSLARLPELCGPNYVWHGPGIFGDGDLAGVAQTGGAFFTAFPDAHWTVDDLLAEGDRVVSRFTVRGTHQGEFMGVPATGKVVTYTGITISRVAGGKCVKDWEIVDALGLLHQLGVMP